MDNWLTKTENWQRKVWQFKNLKPGNTWIWFFGFKIIKAIWQNFHHIFINKDNLKDHVIVIVLKN